MNKTVTAFALVCGMAATDEVMAQGTPVTKLCEQGGRSVVQITDKDQIYVSFQSNGREVKRVDLQNSAAGRKPFAAADRRIAQLNQPPSIFKLITPANIFCETGNLPENMPH